VSARFVDCTKDCSNSEARAEYPPPPSAVGQNPWLRVKGEG
jgi:hypothetical protein